jgi:hypothetical protein
MVFTRGDGLQNLAAMETRYLQLAREIARWPSRRNTQQRHDPMYDQWVVEGAVEMNVGWKEAKHTMHQSGC